MTDSACKHYLNQGVVLTGLVAVAAVKVLEHGGNGEWQKKQPDEDRDMRRFLESFQEVLSTRMHHVKISIDGSDRQEGDAGAPV